MNGKLPGRRTSGSSTRGVRHARPEWGTASSPIIYKDLVIVQCDTQKESFILAFDIKTGKQVWKAARKELPSWATPTVYTPPAGAKPELVTNAPNFIRGYDPIPARSCGSSAAARRLRRRRPSSLRDLIVVASGRAAREADFCHSAGCDAATSRSPEGKASNHTIAWIKGRTRLLHADAAHLMAPSYTCCQPGPL